MSFLNRIRDGMKTAKLGLLTIIALQAATIALLLAQTSYLAGQMPTFNANEVASAIDLSGIEHELSDLKLEVMDATEAAERAASASRNNAPLFAPRCR